jgi:hypothetical protein
MQTKKPTRKKPFAANNASRKLLESEGWTCSTVEQTIPHCFIKRDCYGFGDILACSPSKGIMLVQATGSTGGGNMAARVTKTRMEPRHAIWLASGGRIQVHCWTKRAGQKDRECRRLEITKQSPCQTDGGSED